MFSVISSAHYNSVINWRVLPGVCRRSHVNHSDGQQVQRGEESHAVQTSTLRHNRVCYGRYYTMCL